MAILHSAVKNWKSRIGVESLPFNQRPLTTRRRKYPLLSEAEDVKEVLDRLKRHYPKILVANALTYVPFAGLGAHDPAGTQFDLSQKGMSNVREGYLEEGWEQPRWINHISIRAAEPDAVAEFYCKVLELKGAENSQGNGSIILTDGKVRLLIRPRNNQLYRGLRQGLDHIGFKVENLEKVKKELDESAATCLESAPRDIAVGSQGVAIEKDLQGCRIGKHAVADPDGILLDISE